MILCIKNVQFSAILITMCISSLPFLNSGIKILLITFASLAISKCFLIKINTFIKFSWIKFIISFFIYINREILAYRCGVQYPASFRFSHLDAIDFVDARSLLLYFKLDFVQSLYYLGALLGGPRLLGCLMINLLSRGKAYKYFQYIVLNLTNLQIKTILYLKFSGVNYINDNDGHF